MPFGPFKKKDDKKKTKQMPDHTGLYHKLRSRTNRTNEAINFMRGYNTK